MRGTKTSRIAVAATAGLLTLVPTGSAAASGGDGVAARGPVVDLALSGSVTASSATAGHGAARAADGNAASTWCPTGRSGSVTVDLGRPHRLRGFGVTLAGPASSARARIDVAASPRRWWPAVADTTVRTGVPTWVPLPAPTHGTARYVRVTVSAADGEACVGELRALGHTSGLEDMVLGDDLSFAVQEAEVGNTYRDRGAEALPERVLADHGANYVRLRLWNDPPGGYSDLDSVLTMARRAHAAGMKILLDFHYSDSWADPQKQRTPKAWRGQGLPTLAHTVGTYTRDVLNRLSAQGTPADMVALGNEIRNGMLWPTGKIDWSDGTGWDALGTLLRAAAAGAADADGPTPLIQIHFDQGGDNAFSRAFFDHIVAQHVPFDVIGLSYYPFWHGTLSQLRHNVNDLAVRYDKDIVIAETQYAWTLAQGDSTGNFLWQESQLVPGYPATPDGQLSFVSDLVSILAAVPGGHGMGLFYWQPEWVPGVGWKPGAGTPNDNLTMFDFDGDALPAVQYAAPLRACVQYPNQVPCAP